MIYIVSLLLMHNHDLIHVYLSRFHFKGSFFIKKPIFKIKPTTTISANDNSNIIIIRSFYYKHKREIEWLRARVKLKWSKTIKLIEISAVITQNDIQTIFFVRCTGLDFFLNLFQAYFIPKYIAIFSYTTIFSSQKSLLKIILSEI